nr:hypothetical protein Iba_scaffold35843CG0030 [Ipomoea batatas]GMD95023.1 hypothetical protein Iba_chr15aCG8260 [Ipomoea batatas]
MASFEEFEQSSLPAAESSATNRTLLPPRARLRDARRAPGCVPPPCLAPGHLAPPRLTSSYLPQPPRRTPPVNSEHVSSSPSSARERLANAFAASIGTTRQEAAKIIRENAKIGSLYLCICAVSRGREKRTLLTIAVSAIIGIVESNLVTFASAVAVSFKPPSVCRRQRLLESQPLSPSPPSLLCSLSSSSQPPRLAVAVDVASQPYRRHVHSPRTQAARRHSILILVVFPKKEPLRSKVGMGDGIAMAHQAQAIVSNIEFLIWSE